MHKALVKAKLLGREVVFFVPEGDVSKAIGQHRCNVEKLFRETDTRVYKIVGEKAQNGVIPIERASAEKLLKRSKRTCI